MVFECKGLENRVNDIESFITVLNNGKLDKTAVVQESGTGTDVVMSQKAVTDAIASADPTAEKLHEVIKGTSTVTVDLSQDQQTLNVALDKSQEVQYVELTPASATQGTLTDTQWNTLQVNKGNCITLNNEIYRLADNQNVSGLITYVHTGWDGTARKDKSISITVSTKAWTLVVATGGGGKLYRHDIIYRIPSQSATPAPYIGHVITNSPTNTEEYVISLIKSLKGIPAVYYYYNGGAAEGHVASLTYNEPNSRIVLNGYTNYPSSGTTVTFDIDTVTEL